MMVHGLLYIYFTISSNFSQTLFFWFVSWSHPQILSVFRRAEDAVMAVTAFHPLPQDLV